MKNIAKIFVFLLFSFLFSVNSNAQAPTKMSYQAVIRNASNVIIPSALVGMKISILQGSAIGSALYVETQTPITNQNGLVTMNIGTGTIVSGSFSTINWGASGPFFIKTETDPTGGTSYTVIATSELLSVPFALYAKNSGNAGWELNGNSATSTQFIGTTNNQDLIFKRNGIKIGALELNNVAVGRGTLNAATTGIFNVAIGSDALAFSTASHNIGIGFESQYVNTTGVNNTSVGSQTLRNNSTGNWNSAFGFGAMYTNNGFYNSAFGYESLRLSTGDQNTAMGWNALSTLTTGGGNIGIGRNAQVPTITGNNQLSIGNVIYGANMDSAAGKIGIGVPVPTERLEVAGKTKTTDLQVTTGAGLNKILTSDATGNATWQVPANVNSGIHVVKNTVQTIPNGADTKIDFATEITDDANAFDTTTDEWTIPTSGFYHIEATTRFSPFPANQTVELVIYINGLFSKIKRFSSNNEASYDISANLKLNANDKVTIYIYQTSGSVGTIPASPAFTYFTGYRIY
jgi:hypothetical protein